jgi:hypothetical protein
MAAGAALGAGAIAGTVTAKTTAASLAKLGSKIISRADVLGSYGKVLARLAAAKGFGAVTKRHAHLMLTDSNYRKRAAKAFPEGLSADVPVEPSDEGTE